MNKSIIKANANRVSKSTRKASEKVGMTVRETNGFATAIKLCIKMLILIAVGIFIIFPFYYMFTISLMSQTTVENPGGIPLFASNPSLQNYLYVLKNGYLKAFVFSILVMLTNVVLKLIVCIMMGYAFGMYEFRGKKALWAFLIITMAIPEIALIAAQYDVATGLALTSGPMTVVGLAIPFVAQVFTVYMFKNAFETIPTSVKEAAMIDGVSGVDFFFKIAVPMISSTIWTVVILTAFTSWNSYVWPSLILGGSTDWNTMTLWIFNVSQGSVDGRHLDNIQMASATLTVLPTIIVYVILKKRIDNTVAATGANKG